MVDLAPFDKGGYRPSMPQQPRANEPDGQNGLTLPAKNSLAPMRAFKPL
jgi:hypothetical protein